MKLSATGDAIAIHFSSKLRPLIFRVFFKTHSLFLLHRAIRDATCPLFNGNAEVLGSRFNGQPGVVRDQEKKIKIYIYMYIYIWSLNPVSAELPCSLPKIVVQKKSPSESTRFSTIFGKMDPFCSNQPGQIIATSHDLTPNGALVMEIPLFQENLG